MGITYKTYSLLTDRHLRGIIKPVSQFMHDWMHGMFANGIFNILLCLVLNALEVHQRNIYCILYQFVEQWYWPGSKNLLGLEKIFGEKRRKGNKDGGSFRV